MSTLSVDIPYQNVEINACIGGGNYGDVYKGRWDQQKIAIKKLVLTASNEEFYHVLINEATQLKDCDSEYVVKVLGVSAQSESTHYLVMEYMKGGSLFHYLQDDKREISWEHRWRIATEVGHGMAYLHEKGIVHGHLTSFNVMLDEGRHAKIAGYGFYKSREAMALGGSRQVKWTVRWMAPELLRPGKKDVETLKKADVYSVGIVLAHIASRTIPFCEWTDEELFGAKRRQIVEEQIQNEVPENYRGIMQSCWSYCPEERPLISILVKALEDRKFDNPERLTAYDLNAERIFASGFRLLESEAGSKLVENWFPRCVKTVLFNCGAEKAFQIRLADPEEQRAVLTVHRADKDKRRQGISRWVHVHEDDNFVKVSAPDASRWKLIPQEDSTFHICLADPSSNVSILTMHKDKRCSSSYWVHIRADDGWVQEKRPNASRWNLIPKEDETFEIREMETQRILTVHESENWNDIRGYSSLWVHARDCDEYVNTVCPRRSRWRIILA